MERKSGPIIKKQWGSGVADDATLFKADAERVAKKEVIKTVLKKLVEQAILENPNFILTNKTLKQLIEKNLEAFPNSVRPISFNVVIELWSKSIEFLKQQIGLPFDSSKV